MRYIVANNPIKYVDPSGHFFSKLKKAAKKAKSKVASTAKKAVKKAKKVAKTTKKILKNKNVQRVAIGAGVIAVCGAATILTGGAVAGAGYYYYKKGTTKGISSYVVRGATTGFAAGAIIGAAIGAGRGALNTRCPVNCFVAGTKVLSAKGHVNIEDIQAGDYVWATNPETGETALKKVVRTFVNETDTLVYVKTNDEEITTTLEHPFYVEGKGWTGAGELKDGDKLTLITGQTVSVQSVVVEQCTEPVKVYNFESL